MNLPWSDCEAYVERLKSGHSHVRSLLRSVRDLMQTKSARRQTEHSAKANLAAQLDELQRELRAHFAEEEQGACLEEAACRVPKLAGAVRELEHDHARLLRSLQAIVDSSRSSDRAQARERFQQFERELGSHEANEMRVLRQGFNLSLEEIDEP